MSPKGNQDIALHDKIVDDYRHTYHAHSFRSARRTLLDTAALLGLEEPPSYAEAWDRLTADELARLADLADRQRERLHLAADAVGAELGERRPALRNDRTGQRVDFLFDGDVKTAFTALKEALGQDAPGEQ